MAFILLLALISAAVCTEVSRPGDCTDAHNEDRPHSGVYRIYPGGSVTPVPVYCDMGCDETSVKWTAIQRRQDGTVNFKRGWDRYTNGFGQASGEYWMGLENIHALTRNNKKNYELRIDMEDFEGNKACVYYSTFSVGNYDEGYELNIGGFSDGRCGAAAGDSLTYHDGMKFSTFDKDQDKDDRNCAEVFYGGWWYNKCHEASPNGVQGNSEYGRGITWTTWKGYDYSLKSITMKIRPKP